MTRKNLLQGTALFSVLLLSFHFVQDALHARPGTQAAGRGNLVVVLMLVVVLVGPALLANRRLGQILMVVLALGSIAMPVLHFNGHGDMNTYSGAFFFVWCLIALGVSGVFMLMLLTSELPLVWRGRGDSGDAHDAI